MRKTIYFHVGTVKTGSTLIQKILWENKELLEKFNFHYFNLVEPKLNLPRYANAEFLFDSNIKISDQEIHSYIKDTDTQNIIISEEGLWANINYLDSKAFEGFNKKIILYVRKPADVIAAWASENAEPYNAVQKLHSSGRGVVPIDIGIKEFTKEYSLIFKGFLKKVEFLENVEVVIRPYDREQFLHGDVFRDFLEVLGIDSEIFMKSEELQNSEITNVSRTRKFCDISTTAWDILKINGDEDKYSLDLVEYVYKNSKSGDDRAVIKTLDDDTILEINRDLKFVENELSHKYLKGKPLFNHSLPLFMDNVDSRATYQPLDRIEAETLIYEFLQNC